MQKHAHLDERVTMHVHEEMIDGKKLTEIINETHENVKYLPGHKLPANVVSCPSSKRSYLLDLGKPMIFYYLVYRLIDGEY